MGSVCATGSSFIIAAWRHNTELVRAINLPEQRTYDQLTQRILTSIRVTCRAAGAWGHVWDTQGYKHVAPTALARWSSLLPPSFSWILTSPAPFLILIMLLLLICLIAVLTGMAQHGILNIRSNPVCTFAILRFFCHSE
jgi:hypothetical protein